MKKFCYITLIALAIAGTLSAQTNATTNAAAAVNANTNAVNQILALVTTNPPPAKPQLRGPTRIESNSVDFDLTTREAVYRGHVRADDPEMKLTCEWLVADVPQSGGRINHIVAETNVVIDATDDKGQPMHATADKAVYVCKVENGVTNEVVTLTGHAKVENAQGWLTGEPITLDCLTKRVHADNPKMVYWQKSDTATTGTNVTAVATNSPAVTTNRPVVDTNFPPGKLDLIPSKISKPEPK